MRLLDMTALAIRHDIVGAALVILLALPTPSLHGQPDFGDNLSRWADDGECDDPRFAGDGSAATLLEEDLGHDAADCRALFDAGRIAPRAPRAPGPANGTIDFGDDESEWARDGECDDPRFEGDGAAETLLDADAYHDATDCRTLLDQGRIALRSEALGAGALVRRGRLEDGDDTLESGEYADHYTFTGRAGQRAVIELRSGEFDPYVFVRAPSGEQYDNDDFAGDASRALLSLELVESGRYAVTVTSYAAAETGSYTLTIDVEGSSELTARLKRER
jgi:hypothetical protein